MTEFECDPEDFFILHNLQNLMNVTKYFKYLESSEENTY